MKLDNKTVDNVDVIEEPRPKGIEISDLDRHIILFVKGHYSDYEDVSLKSIFAQWCSLYVSQVEPKHVMNMMLRSYSRLTELGIIKTDVSEMIGELFTTNRRVNGDGGVITPEAIINYIGSVYCDLQIRDSSGNNIIELGEIDKELPDKIKRLLQ